MMAVLKAGSRLLLCLAALVPTSVAFGDDSQKPVTLADVQQSSQLRQEARAAAESGDFLAAAEKLQAAARFVQDSKTSEKAAAVSEKLQAGGGNQFADFTQLIQLITDQTNPPAEWFDIDQRGGRMTQFTQGVFVGAPSLAALSVLPPDNSRLTAAAELARSSNRNRDVRQSSPLRLVSLPRLEKHVQELIEQGQAVPEDVACLAGLTEVQFLFLFPETHDVVIGGPAGDWKTDETGRTVGADTGRPTLKLDDLVTLSRTFANGGSGFFMCSIDPKPEQVTAVREYAANTGDLSSRTVRGWTRRLEEMLGLQNVIVQGIPGDSHVAQVIVDADYRMKEVGIGKRDGADGMKSYFDLLTSRDVRSGSSFDALRWWMVVAYDSLRISPDGTTIGLTGRSVRCMSENQQVAADGTRQSTGRAEDANVRFAQLFTEHLPELARKEPVFAELQNIFDLAMVSALLQTQHMGEQAGWSRTAFAADGAYQPQAVEVPAELMSAANYRTFRTGDVVIQVAGGVRGDILSIVNDKALYEPSEELNATTRNASPVGQSQNAWWWDAAVR